MDLPDKLRSHSRFLETRLRTPDNMEVVNDLQEAAQRLDDNELERAAVIALLGPLAKFPHLNE